MDKFCILRNHGLKFGENWTAFISSPHIKSPIEIHVNAYKCLKNIGIVMKFGVTVYFVNLNHIAKFCYGWSIIAPGYKIGPLKKICLAIMIDLKIILPR